MKKAIVLGASRGIGKSISDSLKKLDLDVFSLSSNDIDTSNLDSVNKFANENNSTDILVLNTGGPPIIEFEKITKEEWQSTIETNLNSHFFFTKFAIPFLKKNKSGSIISNALQ